MFKLHGNAVYDGKQDFRAATGSQVESSLFPCCVMSYSDGMELFSYLMAGEVKSSSRDANEYLPDSTANTE